MDDNAPHSSREQLEPHVPTSAQEVLANDFLNKFFAWASGLASIAKRAAALTAKQAEIAKVATMDLPQARHRLGDHLYATGAMRREHPEWYRKLDNLSRKIRDRRDQLATRPRGESASGKAILLASSARDKTHMKALELQKHRELSKLGETCYAAAGALDIPSELRAPIAALTARQVTLDAEVEALNAQRGDRMLTPKRLAIAVLGFVGVACFSGIVCFGGVVQFDVSNAGDLGACRSHATSAKAR